MRSSRRRYVAVAWLKAPSRSDADAGLVETIVERFGLDGAHVSASLRDGAFNHATATYLLLEERKG